MYGYLGRYTEIPLDVLGKHPATTNPYLIVKNTGMESSDRGSNEAGAPPVITRLMVFNMLVIMKNRAQTN